MKTYKIATIAGDGIGKEVVPESLKILKEIAKKLLKLTKEKLGKELMPQEPISPLGKKLFNIV